MNVSTTQLSAVKLGLFSIELRRFSVKSRVSVFTKTFAFWKSATKAGAWFGFQWLSSRRESPWKDLSSINSFFCIFFSVYNGLMWVFCKYISHKFSIICLIQQKNSYNHHHHHVAPPARISLTLSRHFSLSFIASGRSSELHPVSSHSCCM